MIKNNNNEDLVEKEKRITIYKPWKKINKKYQIIKLLNDNIGYLNEDKAMRLEPVFNNNYIVMLLK